MHMYLYYLLYMYLSNSVDNYILRKYVHLIDLDDFWASHPELHDIPIYYASALAKKCMSGEFYDSAPVFLCVLISYDGS